MIGEIPKKDFCYGPKVGIVNYKTITVTIRLKSYKEILADQNTSYETKLAILNKFFGTTYKSVDDFPAGFKTLPALYSEITNYDTNLKNLAGNIRGLVQSARTDFSEVTSQIAALKRNQDIVHINGDTFNPITTTVGFPVNNGKDSADPQQDIFKDAHISWISSATEPVIEIGADDNNKLFVLSTSADVPYPDGTDDTPDMIDQNRIKIFVQLPSIEVVGKDDTFHFSFRIIGGGDADITFQSEQTTTNPQVSVTKTAKSGDDIEKSEKDETGDLSTVVNKVFSKDTFIYFSCKYKSAEQGQVVRQNWNVEEIKSVSAGADLSPYALIANVYSKTESDEKHLTPTRNIDVAGVTVGDAIPTAGVSVRNRPFRANKDTKVVSSLKYEKRVKADASALDAKADKSSTREWLKSGNVALRYCGEFW